MAQASSAKDPLKDAEAAVAVAASELRAAQRICRDREDRYLAANAALHALLTRS